jgi:hypothetical protein
VSVKIHRTASPKWVDFTESKFYLNKPDALKYFVAKALVHSINRKIVVI